MDKALLKKLSNRLYIIAITIVNKIKYIIVLLLSIKLNILKRLLLWEKKRKRGIIIKKKGTIKRKEGIY
jgi:hypothetical protein